MPTRDSSLATLRVAKSLCKFDTLCVLFRALLIILSAATNETSNDRVDQAALAAIPAGTALPPAPIDPSVDKWFFISGATV